MAYTTKALVRRNLLEKREYYTGVTGSNITLGDRYTESITMVKKNGSTDSSWSFIPPETARTTGTLVAADYVEIQRAILLSDTELDEIIAHVDNTINSSLAKAYTLPLSETPKVIETKATLMCKSFVLFELSRHPEYQTHSAEIEAANSDIQKCQKWLDELTDPKEPKFELVKADNTLISRKSDYGEGSIAVGIEDSTEAT